MIHDKKKLIQCSLLGICTATLFGVVITQASVLPKAFSFNSGSATNENFITLNSGNAVSSSGDHIQKTKKGANVTFTYSNVTSGGHTTLSPTGFLVNKDQITSIETVTCNFSTSGSLKFKTSYDGATWGSETVMVSDYQYPLGSNPYYIQFTAYDSSVTINELKITYSCTPNPAAAGHEVVIPSGTYYQKVTSETSFSGQYLIVYEDDDGYKAFNGSLGTLDAVNNYIDVDHDDDIITGNSTIDASTFTIGGSSENYTIKSASNYYIGQTSNANGLATTTSSGSAYANSISVDSSGNVDISISNTHLRFNSGSDQMRFRYYKSSSYSSQQPIALYKQYTTQGSSHTEYDVPADSIIGFTATDSKANSYDSSDIFDIDNGLTVVANLTGGSTQALSKGGEDGYSYIVKDSNNNTIDTSKVFGNKANATYTLIVSYKNFIPQEITLTVGFVKTLTTISNVSLSKTTYNTAEKLNENNNLDDLTCTLAYNDDTVQQVTYSNFASKGIEVILLTPGGVTYSQTTAFGAAGSWTIRIRSTSNNAVYGDALITVNAIPVQTISVTGSSTSVEEGKTLQLTASVSPATATNQSITWSSNHTNIATVDANGLVTAVAAGEARITATAQDGSAVYGYIDITVTEKQVGADEGVFTLSTGALTIGSYVVFTNGYDGSGYAMSSTQNTNNRPGEAVTIANNSLTRESTSSFRAFLVEQGTTTGTYSFYDEELDGYLYAASSSSNQLKTESTKSANSSWTISGTESKTITAQGSNSRDLLRWNTSAKVFSCYASGQGAPYIFEKAGDPVYATSISIDGDNTVSVGGTTTLSVSFTPNDTTVRGVTWSSSDDTVAGVEDGVVTGIKAGSTTITATVAGEGGTKITATKNITVSNVAVTSVSLNKSTTSITAGGTETLVATISPSNATNKNVTWSTSDNSVATVDGGVVTAIATGTATITVKTVDGNKTASCTVTVTSSGGSGGEETHTISYTDLPTAYETNLTEYTSSTGLKFYAYNCANYSSKVQFKASSGYLQNSQSLELQTITINNRESNTLTVYGGTSSNSITTTISGSNDVYDLSGYHFFKIIRNSSGAAYCSSVTIVTGTPEPVNPTGISVSPSSFELSPNGSKTLSVNYTPTNANQNKAVTWTSSNTDVAIVDTSGKVTVKSTATAGQTAIITAKLTNLPTITATATVTVVETAKADHTVLIYICGADLESTSSYRLATGDITEMLSVSGQPDDVNIVIETGGASSWASTYGISSSKLQRHHVENKSLVTDQGNITYASMGLSSTLQSFIEYGIENFPADRYGLVLWNHGGGMQGVCFDEKKSDDSLLDYEVKNAVSGALSAKGMSDQKLEWIGYDACLMQVQDIAEMNSSYFNYMVASEESEAGYGWDYDTWVDDLYAKKSTPDILTAIVDGFIADNGGVNSSSNDQTLSYLDLSYASAYKTAWENMASQLSTKINSGNKSSFNSLVTSCKYYADTDYTYFGLFDAKDFINKLSSNSTFNPGSAYTSAVLTAHGNLVKHSSCGKGAGNSYGLAMFWACSSNCYKSSYYTSQTTNFTNWRSIVTNFGY